MRLQLAAALTRLDDAGAIRVRRDTTVGQVARSLALAGVRRGRRCASPASSTAAGRRRPTMPPTLRERLAATVEEAARR